MRLILFDCDGTLVDSQHVIVAAMTEAFRRHDLEPPPRRQILSIVGLSLVEAVAALLVQQPDAPVEDVAEAYRTAYRDIAADAAAREPLFPGTRECLAAIASRPDTVLGVATGKSRRGLSRILEHHDLAGFFVTLQTADDAPSKPHPGMVENALAATGAEAHRCVVVGDTVFDVEMAVAAGASAIGVSWGYHPATALRAAGTSLVATAFSEVPDLVERAVPSDPRAAGRATSRREAP